MVVEVRHALPDQGQGLVSVPAVEGQVARYHLVENAADGPHVDLVAVAVLLEYFWRHVGRGSAAVDHELVGRIYL